MGYDFNYVRRFHFWAHKILPLVYDESLSYYEFLCKVMFKLNETIEALNKQNENIENFMTDELAAREAFEQAIRLWLDKIETWLASPFSKTKTYQLGDYVVYNEHFYKCINAVTTAGEFDPSDWQEVTLADDLADWKRILETAQQAFELLMTTRQDTFERNLVEDYDTSEVYQTGMYVRYNGKFYRCVVNNTTGTFDPNDWTQVVLTKDLYNYKVLLNQAWEAFQTAIENEVDTFEAMFVDEYNPASTYYNDMYIRYNNKLYRCNVGSTTGTFDPSDWVEVVLCTDLYEWKRTIGTAVGSWITTLQDLISNLVREYDTTDIYSVGDYTYYNDNLYRCISAVTVPGNFDPSKWTRVVLTEDLNNWKTAFETEFTNFITSFDNFTSAFINDFSTSSTYNVGDYVYYEGDAYRCTTAVTTAGAFDANDWTQVVIVDDLKSLVSNLTTDITNLSSTVSNLSTAWNNFINNYVVEQTFGVSASHLVSQKGITELVMGQNLFNVDDEDVEYGVYYIEGVRTEDVMFNTSGYIPVTEGTTYYEKDGGTSPYYPVNFYDDSMNYVSGIRAADWPITVPENQNIAYMRITFQNGANCAVWLSSIGSTDWYFNPRYNDERIRGLKSQLNGYTISEPMTQAQYDALSTYDSHTIYVIVG